MNQETENSIIPAKPVLKGRSVRSKKPKPRWSSGMFMVIGILMIVSGSMVSATVGSMFFKVVFMLGLAIFTIALMFKTTHLAMRIYYEGRRND